MGKEWGGPELHALSGLLFLGGLAGIPAGCAEGTEERAKTPPFAPSDGSDEGGRDSFDPFATTGDPAESAGAETGGETAPDPSPTQGEGETGVLSTGAGKDEGTGLPDSTEGDAEGSTGDEAPSTSGRDDGSTGSSIAYDPCPYVADLYSDCIESITYDDELDYCQGVLQSAYDHSSACGVAFGDYLACLSFLDCATLLAKGVPQACADAHADQASACSS